MRRGSYLDSWDTPIIRLILFIVMCIIFLTLIGVKVFVFAYKEITTHNQKLEEAYMINNLLKQTYDLQQQFEIKLITKNELEQRKKIYTDKELETQRKTVIKTQTEIAKKICPVGTYVYLEEERVPVRVKKLDGLQAITYEGYMFMVSEDETYHMLSYKEYQLLKDLKYGKEKKEE